MSEAEAIRRIKSGDIGGMEFLVTRYQAKALRAAYLILQDEPLAEDVVQETFVRLFQRSRTFDDTRPFEPYLMRSIVNAALNAAQPQFIQAAGDDTDLERLETLLDQASTLEAESERRSLREEIAAALQQLPPRQRAVIVQRYYLEMSEEEMAQKMKSPPGTIKWLLHQARARLRDLLQAKGDHNHE